MVKRDSKTDRWVLMAMLLVSALALVSGGRALAPLRGMTRFVLIPPADAGLYVASSLRGRLGGEPLDGTLTPRDAEVLAMLGRGETGDITYADLRRLRSVIDARSAGVARYWKAKALAVEEDNRTLANFQNAFGPARGLNCELIPARVVLDDPLPYGQSRGVNVGSRGGARDGLPVTTRLIVFDRAKAIESARSLPVLADQALMGRLSQTGSFSARVMLVTDRSFQCEAQIMRVVHSDPTQRRQARVEENGEIRLARLSEENNDPIACLAEGSGTDRVIVNGVSADHTVKVGDKLEVRLAGTNQGTSVLVGEVVEVTDDPNLGAAFRRLTIAPAADLLAARHVLILRPILTAEGPR
jgi:cell shape-determining protein MreC